MVTGTTTLAGFAVGTTPASAGVGDTVCDSGEICVWSGEDLTGKFRDRRANQPPLSADSNWANGNGDYWNGNESGVIGDQVSSLKNYSVHWVAFFEHPDYSGDVLCVAPLNGTSDLGDLGWDNRISSHRTYLTSAELMGVGCDDMINEH
jgi:hypothetical protein